MLYYIGSLLNDGIRDFQTIWDTIHTLWNDLKWLANCTDNRFSHQQVTERKVAIAKAFQSLPIDLDITDDTLVPARDPGLETMLSHDLGLTLPPT